MDGILTHGKEHRIYRQRQQRRQHQKHDALRRRARAELFHGGIHRPCSDERHEHDVRPARKLACYEGILTVGEVIDEEIIRHAHPAGYAGGVGVFADIVVEFRSSEGKHRQRHCGIRRQRGEQQRKSAQEKAHNRLYRLLPVETEHHRVQQHKASREGDVCLIYPQRQHKKQDGGDAPALPAAAGEVCRENGKKKRQRVGRACEHEAECSRL